MIREASIRENVRESELSSFYRNSIKFNENLKYMLRTYSE